MCVVFFFVYGCKCGEFARVVLVDNSAVSPQKHRESSPLPTDAYFSSVKITEKVEQHAEPKCN